MNPDRALITDKVCGVRVWDLLIRDIRYLGKLVDELPKGPLWSRFSGKTSMSRLLAFQKLGAVFASRALCFAAEKGQRFPMHWLFRAL